MEELHSKILNTEQGRAWLLNSVNESTDRIDFCSAYIKRHSLEYFNDTYLKRSFAGQGRILARWQLIDLLSGASDLSVYAYCRDAGYKFFFKENFHGKIYRVAPGGILIGSFNLTGSGFGLNENSNDEAGVSIADCEQSNKYIEDLFISSIEMDDKLFSLISDYVSKFKNVKAHPVKWSEEIKGLIDARRPEPKLLVNEFFFTPKAFQSELNNQIITDEMAHDLSLLALNPSNEVSLDMISRNFLLSRPYLWLIERLKEHDGELYFGKLSELLHNDLFDDPRPYRRDIKQLLSNLLGWISSLNITDVSIDQPNHSQRIRFNK